MKWKCDPTYGSQQLFAIRGLGCQHLNRSITSVRNPHSSPLSARIELNFLFSSRDDSSRCLGRFELHLWPYRECILRRTRKKAAIKSQLDISIRGADGLVYRDQMGASGEGSLNLQQGERRGNRRKHMSTA